MPLDDAGGLSSSEAMARLEQYGPNEVVATGQLSAARLLLAQVRSPLVLLLVFAGIVSMIAGEWVDAAMALTIVVASALIGFWREYDAGKAIEKLKARVVARAQVFRDGRSQTIAASQVVPGDVLLLTPGSLIPADGVVLEANDFFVNQALLTGETLPVEKVAQASEEHLRVTDRPDAVFQGTNVRSGSARALVVRTGSATVFGGIAATLNLHAPITEFDRGLRSFGQLLMNAMLLMVLGVVLVNAVLHRPLLESLLFAIALSVGVAPEMLPAILSVNLSKSAQAMARHGVLVRRLNAIENFGSMDVLCTDKTGTLTEGEVKVAGSFDSEGNPDPSVLREAAINAHFETGFTNPLDEAIAAAAQLDPTGLEKVDEIPYDFIHKRLSVVVKDRGELRLITKGVLDPLLKVCDLEPATGERIRARATALGAQGFRVIGVATRQLKPGTVHQRKDEAHLTFMGFLTFFDPQKRGVRDAIVGLQNAGVVLKIVSGDSRAINVFLAESVGIPSGGVLTGEELDEMSDEALWAKVESTHIFAQVDPNQKERVILALKKRGHVVGYLGDGINDAPALHAADVSISVDTAADVAKEAADFVLLEQDLDVLRKGIFEGRTTFANTTKYILTTTSANLGNMLSMAAATLFLPFLPLTAGQILLNNLLSDVPALALASDDVDPELVATPQRWNLRFIRRFMVQFGLVSSLFDFVTFAVLLWLFDAGTATFRTGWFIESLLTELVIALVIRTRRPFFLSRPGTMLLGLTLVVAAVDLAIPYLPFVDRLGFTPLPPTVLLAVVAITACYVTAIELLKVRFYRSK